MTRSRIMLWSLSLLVVLALGTAAADAMVETDEERLAEVADVLVRDRAGGRVDALLAWADPSREPVYVSVGRRHERVDEGDDLAASLHDALASLDEGSVDVVQRDIEVRGQTGTVSMRARVQGEPVDVTLTLRREGQGWLLAGVRTY
jgi:hypothetical protein